MERPRCEIVTIVVLMALLAGCSGAGDSPDGATPPSPTSSPATGQIDGMFDVRGHKLHLRCGELEEQSGQAVQPTGLAARAAHGQA
jgi:nitrous oxide reductase accessory protein NosL